MMADWIQDLRYTVRLIQKSPGFSLCVILLLALGIGLNSTIFSLLDALLLRPLAVLKPEELVQLMRVFPTGPQSIFRYNEYHALQERAGSFSAVFGYDDFNAAVRDPSGVHRVRCQLVTGSFFTALGVRPLLGRVLLPMEESQASDTLPAVLSYSYWSRGFGRDPSIIGRKLTLQNRPFTIVGVMPQGFNGLQVETGPDVRVPLIAAEQLLNDPDLKSFRQLHLAFVARLRPGINLEAARAEAEAIVHAALEQEFHNTPESALWRAGQFRLQPIANGLSLLRPKFSSALILLMGAGALMLVIVCANVGGLLLARTSARSGEIAVRLAVGATGGRLLRQWVTESFLLTALGGIAGVVVAWMAMPLVARALPPLRHADSTTLTLALSLKPDLRLLAFSFILCLVSGLLAGLPGALQVMRADLHSAIKQARTGGSQRLRWALVMLQAGLCTIVLAGAGLLVSTLRNLRAVDPGFDRDHVVIFGLNPGLQSYTPAQGKSLQSRLLPSIRDLPGVESAAIATRGLMRGTGFKTAMAPVGQKTPENDFLNTSLIGISPEYFDTMGIRFLAGRNYTPEEQPVKPERVVVNRAFVRHFFPSADPIGQRFGGAGNRLAEADYEIIGVVSDAKYRSLREPIPPTMYHYWNPAIGTQPFILHVRTHNEPKSVIQPMRDTLNAIAPGLLLVEVRTLAEEVDSSLWPERVLAWLAATFSVTATVLVAIAIYGTLAYAIAQAKREIGIRVALGAQTTDVLRLLCRRPVQFTVIGVGGGCAAFYAAGPALRSVLYDVSATDPFPVAGAVSVALSVAALATLVAAIQALRIAPASVLRDE